ncbi:MAG: AIR synthase related protein [Candidatus Bathyarchaeia archaeon]
MVDVKTGKLEWKFMGTLLSLLPMGDVDLIVGPAIGEDAAIIRLVDGFLVLHSDPITTGVKKAGYLAVHVAANDIAVRGVKPRWFLPVVLIPPSYSRDGIEEIFSHMSIALNEIDGVVVGGHTEVTPGLERPIISMTSIGYTTSKVISTRDAKEGDLVYVIGRIAGEGSGIIAWDFEDKLSEKGVDRSIIEKAKQFIYDISVVNTALRIRDLVSTMHDATEGGILQALREIAVASGRIIKVDRDSIIDMLEYEVSVITSMMNVDPLRLLSSGCIIATVPPYNRREFEAIVEEVRKPYRNVGIVTERGGEVALHTKHGELIIREDIIDEIYRLW